jgi:hypothetical protein
MAAGAPGKAPLLGERNADLSSLARVRDNRAAMHEVFMFAKAELASRTGGKQSRAIVRSPGFQTCHIVRFPQSAGREVASEGGFGNLGYGWRADDLTHNLSLSFVDCCQRAISSARRDITDAHPESE